MKNKKTKKSESMTKTVFTMIHLRDKKSILDIKKDIKNNFWCMLVSSFLYEFDINDSFGDEIVLKIFPMPQEKLSLLKKESKK
jgi:hypothetical protein